MGVGSALLPAISAAAAEGDGERFRSAFTGAARLAGVLLIPAAAVILAFPEPCVALLFRHGAYTWTDVTQTASALQMLVPFMLALAGIQIIKKPFFALERRGVLIGVGGLGVLLTGGLGLWLAPTMGVDGLALALSLSTCIQLLAYIIVLRSSVEGVSTGRTLPRRGPYDGGDAPRHALARHDTREWRWTHATERSHFRRQHTLAH